MVFDNGGFEAEAFEVVFAEMVGGAIEEISDEFYFLFCYPDKPLLRPCAALAALLTLEMQASDEPGDFVFICQRGHKEHREYNLYF